MTEMREWWVNVYEHGRTGAFWGGRGDAHRAVGLSLFPVKYRWRVRLKPEGAPKRYASEANRRAWELMPELARIVAMRGQILCYSGPEEDAASWAKYI